MAHTYFLDTNIFVYAQDSDNALKQKIANNLIREDLSSSQGVISSQVVQEFCNVASSKYSQSMKTQDLKEYVRVTLSRLWQHVPTQGNCILLNPRIDTKQKRPAYFWL